MQCTQKLTTDTDKQNLIKELETNTKLLTKLIASSAESVQTKEKLADFMSFILNVLDIEKERIRFESIRNNKRTGRVLRKN